MSKSDVEMEDAEKLHDKSGNNNQESEIDARAAREEEVPCAAAVSGDVNGREHGEEDTNKCRDEDTDKTNVKTEVIDHTNTIDEAREIKVGSDSGIIITKSEPNEMINSETETEAQSDATSSVEKCNVKNKVVEHEASNSGVKENEVIENDVVDGNHNEPIENDVVDGIHGEEVIITKTETEAHCAGAGTGTHAVEKQIGVTDKVVEREATIYGVNENEPIKNDEVDGNHEEDIVNTEIETEAQHAATGAVEKHINVKKEVVEREATNSEVNDNEPTKNDVDGNHGEDVINTSTETESQHAATGAVEKQIDVKKEVVERDATNSGVNENEPTKNDVDGNHGEDVINTATKTEAQVAATGAVGKDVDAKNEVECEATNYRVNENEHTQNDLVDGTHGEDVEKRSTENVLEKELKEVVKDTDDTENVAGETMVENAEARNVPSENRQLPTDSSANRDPQVQVGELDDVQAGEAGEEGEDEEMEDATHFGQDKMISNKEQGEKSALVSHKTDGNGKTFETVAKPDTEESSLANQHEAVTPTSLVRCSSAKAVDNSGETAMTVFTPASLHLMGEDDDGTPEDQAAFMKELEHFYRQRTVDFKPPKFYGQPLNCLKLWRAVIRLGGYDRVTGSKLWRQVGESFHPPKTCTTVSWTFRIFYEKSLLEYERHKTQSGEVQLPIPMLPEVSGGDGEGNGHQGSGPVSGRARRDSAARAMQGWHAQRHGAGEAGEPIIKDKNLNNMAKNEKNLKSIGSLKQKRPNEVEHSSKAARTDISKQLVTSIVDVGPPADWVKINVRQTKECFEVYALVPGLLREEVRVQSDPAGRLVITGQPEQVDNPWGITPFKKVVSLPARIDPVQTSAVVSLHGRLFVRVPLEQPNI